MKLRQLECFRTLMIQGTMTRTAEILGVSQPAVSNMIADLSRELGVTLFTRRLGRLIPTGEAELLFGEINTALEAVENVSKAADGLKYGRSGHLSIAAYASVSINLLPRLIASFMHTRPGLKVKLVTRSSHLVPELISTQQFDLVVAETPADYPLARSEIFSYVCHCVLPPGSPLADKKVITPIDLDGHPFVALVRNAPIHQQMAWAFAQHGAVWNVVAETEYYVSACEMVRAGLGVSLVDPVISAPFFQGLECRPFKPDIHYDIAMLYKAKGPNAKLIGELISHIKPHLSPNGIGQALDTREQPDRLSGRQLDV